MASPYPTESSHCWLFYRLKPDNAAPLLEPHYKAFIAHTGSSASVPRLGTLTLMGPPLAFLP